MLLTSLLIIPFIGNLKYFRKRIQRQSKKMQFQILAHIGTMRGHGVPIMMRPTDYRPLQKNENFLINFQSHERKINSYHDYGAENSCSELIVTSRSNDNIIKSITHSKNKIHGIMWHPERNNPLNELDLKFFKGIFQ